MAVRLAVLWSCSRLEVLGKGSILQSMAEGQNASRRWAGLGWAGKVLETPCLFWELFRTLRFWKAMAAHHNCCCIEEEEEWPGA